MTYQRDSVRKGSRVLFGTITTGEETLSGKGTTHNTNGIIVQRTTGGEEDVVEHTVSKGRKHRSKRCSLNFAKEPIPEFHVPKKVAPPQLDVFLDVVVDHGLLVQLTSFIIPCGFQLKCKLDVPFHDDSRIPVTYMSRTLYHLQ